MNSRTEKRIHKFLKDRGWDQLRPADLAKSVMIEGGELLELFQWENLSLAEIKKELADVLIYALDIAVLLGFDTEKIVFEKLALAEKKYPARLMKKNATAGAGSGRDPLYWKIKKTYRRKGK